MSNIFLVSQGAIVTPDLSESGVAGVMREVVMDRAEAMGIPVTVASVDRSRLVAAESVFLTNSLIGIWPVRRLDNKDYQIDEIVRRLQAAIAH
jgi:4-amino-4-deoxychorismate lyase